MIIASGHKNLNLHHGWRSLADQSGTTVRLKEAISSDKLEQTESPHTFTFYPEQSIHRTQRIWHLWSNVLYQLATSGMKV